MQSVNVSYHGAIALLVFTIGVLLLTVNDRSKKQELFMRACFEADWKLPTCQKEKERWSEQ
jgi:hypothetical protein